MEQIKFVINPHLVFQGNNRVKLLYYGITYTLPERLCFFVQNHEKLKPLTKTELLKVVDELTLKVLIARFLIFTQEEAKYLAFGILDFTKSITQHLNVFASTNLPNYGIIGLPIDSNNFGSYTCKYSPDGIRRYLPGITNGGEVGYVDCGDVQFFPHFESISLISKRMRHLLDVLIEKNTQPLFLGGDHSLTYYCVRSLIAQYNGEGFAIVQFDAHKDLTESSVKSFDHLTNANFIRKLVEDEPRIQKVFQFGIRDHTETNIDNVWQLKTTEVKKAISFIRQNRLKCYITIDMDCLDPSVAPEVNYATGQGLQMDELSKILHQFKSECSVIAMDFMEVCLGKKKWNQAASAAATLIKGIIE